MTKSDSEMSAIISILREIANMVTVSIQETNERFSVTGRNFSVEVLNTTNWLGVSFMTLLPISKENFYWQTDTDLYPVSSEKFAWFRKEIAEDILVFLEALRDGKVLYSHSTRNLIAIIPITNGYQRLERKFIGWSVQTYKNLDEAQVDNSFEPFVVI